MSTIADALRAIEQRAELAIVQELRLMIKEVLTMRTGATPEDRAFADGLLLKIDHLIADQLALPAEANTPATQAMPSFDAWLNPSSERYEVRLYGRDFGDLEDVVFVGSFEVALQLATERHQAQPTDQSEALWRSDGGFLTVRSCHGTVLLHIETIKHPLIAVQPHVERASQALENGDPALVQQLFTALRQVA